jgi:hypothetical protein
LIRQREISVLGAEQVPTPEAADSNSEPVSEVCFVR